MSDIRDMTYQNQFEPDTCYCIINYDIPNSNDGIFIRKCRIHQTSRINDVWIHNKIHQVKSSELSGSGKAAQIPEGRKRTRDDLRESTNPDRIAPRITSIEIPKVKKWWEFWK